MWGSCDPVRTARPIAPKGGQQKGDQPGRLFGPRGLPCSPLAPTSDSGFSRLRTAWCRAPVYAPSMYHTLCMHLQPNSMRGRAGQQDASAHGAPRWGSPLHRRGARHGTRVTATVTQSSCLVFMVTAFVTSVAGTNRAERMCGPDTAHANPPSYLQLMGSLPMPCPV